MSEYARYRDRMDELRAQGHPPSLDQINTLLRMGQAEMRKKKA